MGHDIHHTAAHQLFFAATAYVIICKLCVTACRQAEHLATFLRDLDYIAALRK